MTTYRYEWFHIPTKERGTKEIECDSVSQLFRLINQFNREGQTSWQYWATDY